jgi:hypothetical protein
MPGSETSVQLDEEEVLNAGATTEAPSATKAFGWVGGLVVGRHPSLLKVAIFLGANPLISIEIWPARLQARKE